MIQQIANKEKEYEQWRDHCRKCGGNFDDDCRDCSDWEKKFEVSKSLNWLKKEYKRIYNIEYKKINKLDTMNDNLKINDNMSIKEWIESGIENHGARIFYEDVNNNWTFISDSIKNSILKEISKKIKPEKIETINDVAKLLDGNEYGNELRNELDINIEELCKKNKWIIVFGYSDDNVEIRGAIDDELGAWDGTILKLVNKGDFYLDDCDDYGDEDATYKKANSTMFVDISKDELKTIKESNYNNTCVIEALWCPEDSDASWQFNCKGAEYARFNIMEDEELYGECIVIDLSNLL